MGRIIRENMSSTGMKCFSSCLLSITISAIIHEPMRETALEVFGTDNHTFPYTNILWLPGDPRFQPGGAVLPARGAGGRALAPRARRLLPRAALPRAAAHLHHRHLRADQVRQHQAQDQQQARQPHVAHRVQQLHQAARAAAAAGGARAVAPRARRPRRVLPGAPARRRAPARLPARPRAPAPRQLSRRPRPPPRHTLIDSLLLYERDARRDLFFYFPRGRSRRPLLVISVRFSITFCILVRYVDV